MIHLTLHALQVTASVSFLPLLDEPCESFYSLEWVVIRNRFFLRGCIFSYPWTFTKLADQPLSNLCWKMLDFKPYRSNIQLSDFFIAPHVGSFDLLVYTDSRAEVPTEWCVLPYKRVNNLHWNNRQQTNLRWPHQLLTKSKEDRLAADYTA